MPTNKRNPSRQPNSPYDVRDSGRPKILLFSTSLALELLEKEETDYWKSQDRKFCDFCQCWLSDNKASVEFHENGKRHKENVKKRLRNITKKSIKDQRDAVKVDEAISRMEQAGLEAYRADVANNVSDISSQALVPNIKPLSTIKPKTPWFEAKTGEGEIYYWNTETNQSIWDEPPEGFLTMAEQQDLADKQAKLQLKEIDHQKKLQSQLKLQEEKELQEEARAAAEREKLKSYRVQGPAEPPPFYAPVIEEGKNTPYGQWRAVEVIPKKSVDLQLPQQEYIAIHVPASNAEPTPRVFKEKTISKLPSDDEDDVKTSNSTINFKKRKFNSVQKKNMRQRLDDD